MNSSSNQKLIDRINQLRQERGAVILAHNYQRGEVQDIVDFSGDSLELSQKAAKTDAEVIVFCGVHFMAETAAILSPDKKVLLPDVRAGCPMANMISVSHLRRKKAEYPNALVVCYVNSTAEVKAESDICCTSSNAVNIVNGLPSNKDIIFVPDQYLGNFVAEKTGRNLILWQGYCPTHARILAQDIIRCREENPNARVVVHPECRPEVITLADEVTSTSGICRYAQSDDVQELIVGTEMGIIHRLQKENPNKRFIPVSKLAVCPNMKLITLEKVLWTLEEMAPEVSVEENIRIRALESVDRMLAAV